MRLLSAGLLVLASCISRETIRIPSPAGARSIVIAVESSVGEVTLRSEPLPLSTTLPDLLDGADGVLAFYDKSLGALRLEPGEVMQGVGGRTLQDLGKEVGATAQFFEFVVGRDEYEARTEPPLWAEDLSLPRAEVRNLCPTFQAGPSLDISVAAATGFVQLPNGAALIAGVDDERTYVYRIEPSADALPTAELIGDVAGSFKRLAWIDDMLVFYAVDSGPEASLVFFDGTEAQDGRGLTELGRETFPLEEGELKLMRLLPGTNGLPGTLAITFYGDVYRRNDAGTWLQILDGDSVRAPTACEQTVPDEAASFGAFWASGGERHLGLNFGAVPDRRARIVRITEGEVTTGCLPDALVGAQGSGVMSIKVTGAHAEGFMFHQNLDRFRLSLSPNTGAWDFDGTFTLDQDISELLDIELGDDAPVAYLAAGDAGELLLLFEGGPTCDTISLSNQRPAWMWRVSPTRYLVSSDGVPPRWIEIRK